MTNKAFIKIKIERLELLLAGRKAEYEVFGASPSDIQEDANIRRKIVKLEGQLKQ